MTLGGLIFMLAVLGALVMPYMDWDKHTRREFMTLCAIFVITVGIM